MIPEARAVECVRSNDQGDFQDKGVYVVDGQQGFFRRIGRTRHGLNKSTTESVVAHCGDRLVEVVRWMEFDVPLAKAGYGLIVDGKAKAVVADEMKVAEQKVNGS